LHSAPINAYSWMRQALLWPFTEKDRTHTFTSKVCFISV
jgi:hypothetical protein